VPWNHSVAYCLCQFSADCTAGKLSQARDFQEVYRIQTEFMQTQFNSFAEQARSLGEAYTKAATDATMTLSAHPISLASTHKTSWSTEVALMLRG
jgi:hypothetical protein